MTINCETAPIILPPVAKNPNNKGGIVHGTSKTTRGQNPIVVKNQPIVNPTAGTIKNGIPKIGFNTIGKPKVIVSLILNNPGTIDKVADEDKYDALKIIMRQYHAEDFKFNTDMMKVTTVLRLTVTDITAKRNH